MENSKFYILLQHITLNKLTPLDSPISFIWLDNPK
jgi:hypothetical protein